MPIRGRVGRHTRQGGRHCQNWPDDQRTVIVLLNRIPLHDGGTAGSLGGRIVAGMASDVLYRAISAFEDRQFPGQHSGFVDPGGRMQHRMEELAVLTGNFATSDPANDPVATPVVPTSLDRLRDHLRIDAPWHQRPAAERAAFAPLVAMAEKHIDSLKEQGLGRLPWPVELFGRAHITQDKVAILLDGSLKFILEGGKLETRSLPEMRFGSPVEMMSDITTEKLGALLLYDSGFHIRVFPHHGGRIWRFGARDASGIGAMPEPLVT